MSTAIEARKVRAGMTVLVEGVPGGMMLRRFCKYATFTSERGT